VYLARFLAGRWTTQFVLLVLLGASGAAGAVDTPLALASLYASRVAQRLEVPVDEAQVYGRRAQAALIEAGVTGLSAQYFLVVDRSPQVQAIFLFWWSPDAPAQLIGASPVSTGRGGRFAYFETPTGVFEHSLDNPDFRAEGTRNSHGIRGFGVKGLRVFDFGWQLATRQWGDGGVSPMRLLLHATDPDWLESRLGTVQSQGCVRIPASLNQLIDEYGLLDADYETGLDEGKALWMLHPQRTPTPWSGRYLIVVDSQRAERPIWAIWPATSLSRPLTSTLRQSQTEAALLAPE
jgi:hypothetical protein